VTHTVFIDLDSHVATASATGTAAPDVPLKHLTKQTLAFAFHSSGTVAAVTGWSTGRVVIKATPTSDVLLLDTTLAATGSTTSTRYSAEWAAVDCDSAALRALIGASVEPLDVFAEIQWTADSGTHAVAFPIQIVPTFNLPEDAPPDPTEEASWTWLKARLAAGSNITFTDNDTTQVRTIAASGGGGGGGGGSVDWGDIDGTLSNQTDLQTALNNKQPLASALTTLSSATAAGLALMDDADNAAQRTTLGLGNASTRNVGTTAGTVAAGDDSRLSDARTPTAHAASHITGGSDAIQSATASQNGLATAAQITKLDGIEALADVTDAANVGGAIHGATAKTTPVDADTVSLIDSAASNVLKKLSWTNIKATLKTYFDALYVTGPASATDNAIVRFDGTTGKLVQNSGATVSDAGVITAPTLQSTPGNTSGAGAGGSGGIVDMRGGSGAEGSESGTTFAAGGHGGQVYTVGGSAFADDSLGYQFAGGSGGNINTAGGNASVDGAGARGGAIYTANGGGSIDTLTGYIQLGPEGSRTTIQGNNSGDTSILLPPTEGTAGQFLSTDGAGNWDWSTPSGSGDALTTNPLSQFAPTTSDQLRGVISDETGSGALVFANSPTLVTPALGTPASGVLTNCTGLPIAGLASFVGLPVSIQLACSDEGTALTTGAAKLTFRMPHAMTLTAVRASVGTAPTGSTLVVDINEGGASILGTKLSIDATEKTSTTAASAATITDATLADDAEITIDIDQIGSTIAGAGLKVTLIGTRA